MFTLFTMVVIYILPLGNVNNTQHIQTDKVQCVEQTQTLFELFLVTLKMESSAKSSQIQTDYKVSI